jgi:hypothetical protein
LSQNIQLVVPKIQAGSRNPVPKLNLKTVGKLEDFRDWQAYCFKLEEANQFQRERVKFLEEENLKLTVKFKKEKKAVKEALHLNSRLLQALDDKKAKYK